MSNIFLEGRCLTMVNTGPKFVEIGLDLAKFGRVRSKIGRVRAHLVDFGPMLVEHCLNFGRILPKVRRRTPPTFGRHRPKFGRHGPKFPLEIGSTLIGIGRCLRNTTPYWSTSARGCPTVAQIGQHRPNVIDFGHSSADVGPDRLFVVELGPNLVHIGQDLAEFGPRLAETGHTWPTAAWNLKTPRSRSSLSAKTWSNATPAIAAQPTNLERCRRESLPDVNSIWGDILRYLGRGNERSFFIWGLLCKV